jgi:hypothetical protein
MTLSAWNGHAATGEFPQEAAGRLVEADVTKLFANLGIESVGTTQQEAIDLVHRDMPVYEKIVDMAGVRLK